MLLLTTSFLLLCLHFITSKLHNQEDFSRNGLHFKYHLTIYILDTQKKQLTAHAMESVSVYQGKMCVGVLVVFVIGVVDMMHLSGIDVGCNTPVLFTYCKEGKRKMAF